MSDFMVSAKNIHFSLENTEQVFYAFGICLILLPQVRQDVMKFTEETTALGHTNQVDRILFCFVFC